MPRLIQDRYFAYDELRGCDLTTGHDVRLDDLPADPPDGGSVPLHDSLALAPLVEVLNDGQDGDPRWVVADARNGAQAAAMVRRAAADARRRGFVPLRVPLYLRWRDALAQDLEERTLLLIGSFARSMATSRAALVQAASFSPRPHVLLTFRSASTAETACVVREARAAYGVLPASGRANPAPMAADVVRHIERAARATEFHRAGRHAAAERLLRDVAGSLVRRAAFAPAATTLVTLGRILLERGRATAAEKAFDEAAHCAQSASDEPAMLDARLWQAAARTDAGRLTDAESVCRAVLLTRALSPVRQAWAHAILIRILLWQGRSEEAAASPLPPPQGAGFDLDPVVAASIDATAVRVLLAAGDVFQAGQRARALVTWSEKAADPLPRVAALTAHLRVLAAAGDLDLTEQRLREIVDLSRQARAPLRAVRAKVIWYDALRRARRGRAAQRELHQLARMGRVGPALLRRAVEQRVADHVGEAPQSAVAPACAPPMRALSMAVPFLRLAHEEESDRRAVQCLLDGVARELHPTRVDLVSCDAGPASTLMTTGGGLATRLGPRVLEAGIVIPEEVDDGGREIGIPIRLATRLLAALVCRWPLDRQPPPHAIDVLDLAAAIAAPRVDALLAGLREMSLASTSVPELIGTSAAMAEVRRAIERAARAPFAVLIEGESGVGKELAARALHQLSARRERRFCDVNCAALPDDLLESELFGHVRGAFTGAVADKAGLFEDADGGTLFLDEVPDLSPRGQAKLLRVLQQQEVRRVGETFSRKVDVRLVTAANRDMRIETAEERFRPDLLYRLDVIRIRIPPLRERPEDIAVLAQHCWRASAARVESAATLTHALLAELARYHWPGNVRELQNVMAALAVAAPARGRVRPSLLPAAITGSASISSRRLADARAQFERRCVEVALARASGSRTRAAAELGLSRQGLLKAMTRLGLDPRPCNGAGEREQ
ncbi:MAG: sigma 54-interacting transcriptional regulator [Acidobacteria bacterium]|nr:sigma 54-interacting transcriptional regulator [Acidobacteriota bacterium]